jgi:hypothetical protein
MSKTVSFSNKDKDPDILEFIEDDRITQKLKQEREQKRLKY